MNASHTEAASLPDGLRAEKDVVYGSVNGRDLLLDLYWYPNSEDTKPLIIWVHGGAWRRGKKENIGNARPMLERGYAVASVGYRLSGEAIFPAQIQDCKAAVRWLRAHANQYKLNGDKFGAWGSSAGGHLVALMGTADSVDKWEVGDYLDVSSGVQAVCDWFGPTDFLRMNDVKGNMDHDAPDSPESQLVGAPIQDHPDLAANADPISYVSDGDPPFLIMHGMQDFTVLKNQSELLNVALQKFGVSSTYVAIEDQGHGFRGERADIYQQVSAFFDRHLRDAKPEADGNPWTPVADPGVVGSYTALFESNTIDGYASYMVYLPPSYETETERQFPVMYWLHGRNGNPNRVKGLLGRFDSAMRGGQCPEMIVVAPNGLKQSMYCDSRDGKRPVETVIVQDLIGHIDATYRTVADREHRAVDGFSMGGFGAAHLGFKYPDLFGAVSIMGGALHRAEFLRDERSDIFVSTFGSDLEYCRVNTPWALVEANRDAISKQLIRQYVGEKDSRLLEKNKEFHALLEELEIPHTFGIAPDAGHNPIKVHRKMLDDPFVFYRTAFGSQE